MVRDNKVQSSFHFENLFYVEIMGINGLFLIFQIM